ncbi:MAG: AAA family ATPase [Gemmatimonadaceae bacterium]|jgi:DNA repair exonuclease SbcCD ATPase subunit
MMTRIRRVMLHNLFAFADLDLSFPDGTDVVALVGDNRCGKSSFMEAILFILTGEVRHGKTDTIVRRGCKTSAKDPAYGLLELDTDDGIATVKRGRAGINLLLEVSCDGTMVATGTQADDYIRDHLLWGRSPADLLATAFARTGDVHQLSELDPAKRKALMMSWYPQLNPFPGYLRTVRDKIAQVEASLARVADLSPEVAAQAQVDAITAVDGAQQALQSTAATLAGRKADLEAALAVAAGSDQSARLREIAGILRDCDQMTALELKVVGVDAEGLRARGVALEAEAAGARLALDAVKAEAVRAEGATREIAALERLLADAARRAAMMATWANDDLMGLTAEAQESEAELASRKAVQAEIVGEARAVKDLADDLRRMVGEGFSGECPVDHKNCPRTAEINGDHECIASQYREAQARHDTAQANLANVNEAVREAEADVKDARERLASFNADAAEVMRLNAAGADRDAAGIITDLNALRATAEGARDLPMRIVDAEKAVKQAEQAVADCTRVAEQYARDTLDLDRLRALVQHVDCATLRTEQTTIRQAQESQASATQAVERARQAVARGEIEHADANRLAGVAAQRLTQAEAELARVQVEMQRAVKTRALLTRLQYVERACGADGIPAIVLENLIADVEARANGILTAMRAPFAIEFAFDKVTTQKEKLCACGAEFLPRATTCARCGAVRGMQRSSALDLQIIENGESHSFSEDSGAGRAMASLAIRLGVARSMGVGMALIDEAADAMDEKNRAKFCQMIGHLSEAGFNVVLFTSQHKDVQATVPVAIEFTKANGVSSGRWA